MSAKDRTKQKGSNIPPILFQFAANMKPRKKKHTVSSIIIITLKTLSKSSILFLLPYDIISNPIISTTQRIATTAAPNNSPMVQSHATIPSTITSMRIATQKNNIILMMSSIFISLSFYLYYTRIS